MKSIIHAAIILTAFFFVCAPSVHSQTEVIEGYTFIKSGTMPQLCLGRWIPPETVGFPGVCEGQLVDVAQLTAVSAKLSADRLEQLLNTMTSIDEKLAINNEQINNLLTATVNTQLAIDEQVRRTNELLREAIDERFAELPEEILSNELFRKEIRKLKFDILKEISKRYQERQNR